MNSRSRWILYWLLFNVRDETLVRHWKGLCVEVVGAPSSEVFEARLDGPLSNLIC